MDEGLIAYIRKNLYAGFDRDKIKQALLNAGWDIKVIESHMDYVIGTPKISRGAISSALPQNKPNITISGSSGAASAVSEHAEGGSNINRGAVIGSKKSKDKKIKWYASIILILIAVAVISVIGISYFSDFNKKREGASGKMPASSDQNENLNLFNKALISHDIRICDKIGIDELKSECKNRFNSSSSDIAVCDEKCGDAKLFNKAIIDNNKGLCVSITDEILRKNCFGAFNKATGEACDEACMDNSFLNLALIKNNGSICLKIIDSSMKNRCEQAFAGSE